MSHAYRGCNLPQYNRFTCTNNIPLFHFGEWIVSGILRGFLLNEINLILLDILIATWIKDLGPNLCQEELVQIEFITYCKYIYFHNCIKTSEVHFILNGTFKKIIFAMSRRNFKKYDHLLP